MKKVCILLIGVLSITACFASPVDDDLIITLPGGRIRGSTYVSPSNVTYYGFRGIPFAKPPVGKLRFQAPQPPEPWTGIIDAFNDSKSCITDSYLTNKANEDEDCLYINVYSPNLKRDAKLPVLFWIYGGQYLRGNSARVRYNPDFLIEDDVVVVLVSYRVGPFGFLSTGDSVIPGNAGLKDQLMGLKWTNKNIRLFGGDPKKVTIFGQSAGGASVGLQLLSKKSAGLFRGAIFQSGSGMNNWTIEEHPLNTTRYLTSLISSTVNLNDTKKIRDALQSASVLDIMKATAQAPNQSWPVLEKKSKDAFITKSHYEILKNGEFNRVPIIAGMCSEESLFFLGNLANAKAQAVYYDTHPRTLVPYNLNPKEEDVNIIIAKIKSIYLNEGETFAANLTAVAKYFSDNLIARGILEQAELESKFVPVYLYQFSYYGNRTVVDDFIPGADKVGHGGENLYLFDRLTGPSDPVDLVVQKRMVKLWTNFAKYLDPTPKISGLLNVTWPTFNVHTKQYLDIDTTLEVRSYLKEKAFSAWSDIFETYGSKPLKTY